MICALLSYLTAVMLKGQTLLTFVSDVYACMFYFMFAK